MGAAIELTDTTTVEHSELHTVTMKKGNLPTQEYTLLNVCMQTMEAGTPLTCDDCGRVIFNIATIRGKSDGKTYNVGLSCVKKLLNKAIYFDMETLWEYERKESEWRQALNTLKRLQKYKRENEGFEVSIYRYKDGETFCITHDCKTNHWLHGSTAAMTLDKLPLFSELITA